MANNQAGARPISLFILVMLLASACRAAEPATQAQISVDMGHTYFINAVAYSGNGEFLASGSVDKSIKIRDARTGRELHTLTGHTNVVESVALSRNGAMAVSAGAEGAIRIWDVPSGRTLKVLTGHKDAVFSIALAPDEKTVASASNDGTVRLWDIASGNELRSYKAGPPTRYIRVAFSPDGRTIAAGSSGGLIRLWDAGTGNLQRTIKAHVDSVQALAYSADGSMLASGSSEKLVKLWDARDGHALQSLPGAKQYITSVSFSPDGQSLAAAAYENTIQVYDLRLGTVAHVLSGHREPVTSVVFSPDGKTILSGSRDQTMRQWDAASGDLLRNWGATNNPVHAVAFSNDGRYYASGSWNNLSLWNAQTGQLVRMFSGRSHFRGVAISPDSKTLAAGMLDSIKVWDIATGKIIQEIGGQKENLRLKFSGDGRLLVAGSSQDVSAWNTSNWQQLYKVNVTWSYGLGVSPDSKLIATEAGPPQWGVRLWDSQTGKFSKKTESPSGAFSTLEFSPDGQTIAVAGIAHLALIDVASGKIRMELDPVYGQVGSTAFSPDGKLLASAYKTGEIKLWDTVKGRLVRRFEGHTNSVTSVAFAPDGKTILSGSEDGSARRWDVASGKQLAMSVSFYSGDWVTINPDGYYVASDGGDKYLNVHVGSQVFGVEQYREAFYRPALVAMALGGAQVQGPAPVAMAAIPPAPLVRIASTPEQVQSGELRVTLELFDKGGGIGDVRLYLNGSAISLDTARGLSRADNQAETRTYTVRLVNGKNSLRALAFNANNTMQSDPATREISASLAVTRKPSLHALVIGIDNFKNPRLRLNYPAADAELFASTIKATASPLFDQVIVHKLTTSEETSKQNIKQELMKYRALNPDDLFIFYVASHGTVDDGEYFLLTSNVGSVSTRQLRTDALTQAELKELLANIPTTKKVIVLDTCNAGAMGDALQSAFLSRGLSEDAAIKVLSRAVGSTILSASTSTQEALEGYRGHGLFTYVLAEGLKGKADKGRSGFVKTTDLVDYVDSEVPNLAESVFKHPQYPTTSTSGQGFYLGRSQAQ